MDLRDLGKLYTADGPFVTLYLDVPRNDAQAEHMYATRWQDLLRELRDRGVDAPTIEALDRARGSHTEGGTRVLVASHGQVHLATYLPERPGSEIVRLGELPHLLPLLDSWTLRLPHLLVVAARDAADITAYTTGSEPLETETVQGRELHTRKVSSGGWNMRHMQARAEDGWEHNAKDVAAEVERIARDVQPRLIALAGDVRAVQLLEKHLPAALQPLVREVGGNRSDDGGDEHVAERVIEALAEVRRDETLALVEEFGNRSGQAQRAAAGLVETVTALRRGQVETLLLTDTFDGARPLWFTGDPTAIGVTADEVTGVGDGTPTSAPAADVLVRAATATDARIRLVAGDIEQAPREGIGALLRYASG